MHSILLVGGFVYSGPNSCECTNIGWTEFSGEQRHKSRDKHRVFVFYSVIAIAFHRMSHKQWARWQSTTCIQRGIHYLAPQLCNGRNPTTIGSDSAGAGRGGGNYRASQHTIQLGNTLAPSGSQVTEGLQAKKPAGAYAKGAARQPPSGRKGKRSFPRETRCWTSNAPLGSEYGTRTPSQKLARPSLQTKPKAIAGRPHQLPVGYAMTAPFLKENWG